ncbi:CoA transferase [Seongchinamella unica]|nr:CoA transferase [Seongchinamella unica]
MQKILPASGAFQVKGNGDASRYATQLLRDLGALVSSGETRLHTSAAQRWSDSGLAELTGFFDQPPADCPIPLASYGDGVLHAFETLLGKKLPTSMQGGDLMAQRATVCGLHRRGEVSPGGSCKILPTADGHLAVNLARDSDWRLLDAWLQAETAPTWSAVEAQVVRLPTAQLVERGRLLGLAITSTRIEPCLDRSWFEVTQQTATATRQRGLPRVVDLSSLWAGPLCSRLLQWAGAEVIKVESRQRPDGARHGSPEFFSHLNSGKQQLQLDLHKPGGVKTLEELIRSADIVIEGSRPRALRQMGIQAESLLVEVPGLTWVSISGYGRSEPQANWIAYGDDAGVAGGLSALLHQTTGRWMFCGDAIADPLTGMHAALAALASWQGGGGHLLAFSLVQTVQHCVAFSQNPLH